MSLESLSVLLEFVEVGVHVSLSRTYLRSRLYITTVLLNSLDKVSVHSYLDTVGIPLYSLLSLGYLVAGLSPCSSGFLPKKFHMGFVVNKTTLGQLYLLLFPPLSVPFRYFSLLRFHSTMVDAM